MLLASVYINFIIVVLLLLWFNELFILGVHLPHATAVLMWFVELYSGYEVNLSTHLAIVIYYLLCL